MINNWNTYCGGCSSNKCSCNTTFQSVTELPTLGEATRGHAYILPDNTVWTLNSDGTGFTQLNGGTDGAGGSSYDDTELRELITQLQNRNTMEDNRLTNIENLNATQNSRLTAIENKPSSDVDEDDLIPLWQEIKNAQSSVNEFDSKFEELRSWAGEGNQMANDSYQLSLENNDAIREINRKIEVGELGGGATYTAGQNISISNQNKINFVYEIGTPYLNDEMVFQGSMPSMATDGVVVGIGNLAFINTLTTLSVGDVLKFEAPQGKRFVQISAQKLFINGIVFTPQVSSDQTYIELTVADTTSVPSDAYVNINLTLNIG